MTTGTTTGCTGCTGICRIYIPNTNSYYDKFGCTDHIIIPDTGVTYNVKILLTQELNDIGFLDAYMLTDEFDYINLSGVTSGDTEVNIKKFESFLSGGTTFIESGLQMKHSLGNVTGTTINYVPYIVTGACTNRLSELRKYTITTNFNLQYFGGGTSNIDGVDYSISNSGSTIVYYLGGIKYINGISSGTTTGITFSFTGQSTSSADFINKPTYKNPNKENIISNPKINNDLFIDRQELSAFDKNYKLEFIRNISDLETYAAGGFFTIIQNK